MSHQPGSTLFCPDPVERCLFQGEDKTDGSESSSPRRVVAGEKAPLRHCTGASLYGHTFTNPEDMHLLEMTWITK